MEHLLDKLKQAVEIQNTKTYDTQLAWVGGGNDFIKSIAGTYIPIPLKDDTYIIMVSDHYILFNKEDLTEDLVNEIKRELGI